ncbi:MAG: iron ABC transporter permease [Puniceicoccales bacterium]|jgi:iron(III) transport system permease protein|nr:iron ABC transporter permease [Puniceicoccales bacterium]
MSQRAAWTIFAIALLIFGCFLLLPLWATVRGGFVDLDGHFTLAYLAEAFANPLQLKCLGNSLTIALLTTTAALLLAFPLAFFSCRYEFPGKRIFSALVLVPLILPPFLGAIGILKIFGSHGILNALLFRCGIFDHFVPIDWLGHGKLGAVVLFQALSLYPILFLNISAALANIDPAMEEAAAALGCVGLRRFFRVTFPLARPGVFAGVTIVFIWSFTELGVPLIFNYVHVLPVQIFSMLKELGNNPFPYALATVVLFLSTAFYWVGKRHLAGRDDVAMLSKASHSPAMRRIGPGKRLFCTLFFAIVTALALLPHLVVICYSFAGDWFGTILPHSWTLHNYAAALGHPLTVSSIRHSLLYAGCATLAAAIFGTLIALVIVRSRLRWRGLLDALAMLPLAVPGIIIAFGYLVISQKGKFFSFLNPIENPTALLIIAYAIRKLPLMVRAAVAGLQQTSATYEEAAASLGSRPLNTYCRITIPLILSNLIAGGLLVFSQTMLEVSDSLIIAQKQQFYPITKAIYELMNLLGNGPFLACALGVWAMAFLAVALSSASVFMGKNLGAIFRA